MIPTVYASYRNTYTTFAEWLGQTKFWLDDRQADEANKADHASNGCIEQFQCHTWGKIGSVLRNLLGTCAQMYIYLNANSPNQVSACVRCFCSWAVQRYLALFTVMPWASCQYRKRHKKRELILQCATITCWKRDLQHQKAAFDNVHVKKNCIYYSSSGTFSLPTAVLWPHSGSHTKVKKKNNQVALSFERMIPAQLVFLVLLFLTSGAFAQIPARARSCIIIRTVPKRHKLNSFL